MRIFKEKLNEKVLLSVVVVVALTVIFFSAMEKEEPVSTADVQEVQTMTAAGGTGIPDLEKTLEERIASNLSSIQGVGKTKVLVTFTSGMRKEYAKDGSVTKKTSKETDKEGGTRETVEVTETNQLVIADSSPVIIEEQLPEVAGVLVISQGASDSKIKEQIFEAVKTLLNIQPSKISVAPMGGV